MCLSVCRLPYGSRSIAKWTLLYLRFCVCVCARRTERVYAGLIGFLNAIWSSEWVDPQSLSQVSNLNLLSSPAQQGTMEIISLSLPHPFFIHTYNNHSLMNLHTLLFPLSAFPLPSVHLCPSFSLSHTHVHTHSFKWQQQTPNHIHM